jgi:peptidyl-prolyl cis-trans isomerase D
MFDLFRRKDTNLRILLGVLLGLVALSMVVTLIPGFGGAGINVGLGEETVAKVCGENVTAREVRTKLQQMLNKQNLPPESAAIFIPQFVDQFVAVKGVACYAQESGMLASDEELAKKIQKDVPSLWQDGKFVGRQMYEAMLKQNGLTVAQFEDSIRKDIETQRLRTLVLMSAVATPKEVEDIFRDQEERIKLQYVAIDPQEITRGMRVPEEEIKAKYEKEKTTFNTTERRKVTLYTVDASVVNARVEVSEGELRKLYQDNLENYRVPERSSVRHILFKAESGKDDSEKKARQQAESVYKQLKAGAKFEELAAKYSEDPGSKSTGGSIGFITRGQTVKNFDEYAFTAPLKTLSSPIKTEFGYHLIEVMERQSAGLKSFEEIKPQLEAELRNQKNQNGLGQAADALRAELAKNTAAVPATASRLGITPVKFEYQNEGFPVPGIGSKAELFTAVQRLKRGEVTEAITIGEGRMAVLSVDEIVPPRMMTFEEARPNIISTLTVAAGLKKTNDLKEKAAGLMGSVNGDFAKLAKELSLPVKETQEFNRSGFADGIGPASAVLAAFNKKAGDLVGPVTVDGKWFVAKVLEKKEADLSQLPARRAEMVNLVKNRKASERADIFEETLVRQMIKAGKITVFEDAKKRIAQSYGG